MKRRYLSFAKKALAVFLASLMVGAVCPTAFAATETAEKNYIIESPQVTGSLPLMSSARCTMLATTT